MADQIPAKVKIVEVGPRDGLQNEPQLVDTDDKVAFVNRLTRAGFSHIEVTSFVSPRWVPQLGDAADVYAAVDKLEGIVYSALVPNLFGMQRALAAGVTHAALFTAASETFNQHNINASIEESLVRFVPVCERARQEGVALRGYISTSFGCPYEGQVRPADVAQVARALFDLGIREISLGDTNGVAVPTVVGRVLEAVSDVVPVEHLAVHFHDTHGRALANVYTALTHGVAVVDSSAGGLGGCPYSPGASGNLASEDLLDMLHGMGIETGIDLDALIDASLFIEGVLGRPLPSRHLQTVRSRRRTPVR